MHWIDWLIVVIPLFIVCYIGWRTQHYLKGVSEFLTAGRAAGRYVICVAGAEAAMGLISLVAMFEAYYNSGFAYSFWSAVSTPIMIVLGLMGYCIYRFRETRAMTMGQFYEIRYSKSFRIFAAILQSISGILNYAIFPAVGARFLVYYCELPVTMSLWGWEFQTFGLVMLGFLSVALAIVMLGGQITTMVTDCVQGILSYPMYLIVVAFIIWKFSWFNEMAPTLLDRPPGKSMLNPFDISGLEKFNLFYVLVGIVSSVLNRLSWSGAQAYNTAAATPHEQKMGGVLGSWRSGFSNMMYVFLAIAAFTFLHHANYASEAKVVRTELARKAMEDVTGAEAKFVAVRQEVGEYLKTGKVSPELRGRIDRVRAEREREDAKWREPQPKTESKEEKKWVDPATDPEGMLTITKDAIQSEDKGKAQTFGTIFAQMRVPVALRTILPIGITGVLCAIGIFLLVSTDTTYLHSWGSILVQDVVLPFRKTPFTPHQQLFWLRIAIASVATFAFFFSYFFGQVDYILMFFAITGAIYLGGAGPCIVGGLYWKRGTSVGAFAALASGSILAVAGFIGQKVWVTHLYPWLVETQWIGVVRTVVEGIANPFRPYINWQVRGNEFPINSQEIYFIAMMVSLALYVGLSLLTCRQPFNMERMLHRGKYRLEGKDDTKMRWTPWGILRRLLGFDSQYTLGDKILAWSVFLWSFGWGFCFCFLGILIWNRFRKWPNEWWANWFFITNFVISAVIGIVSTVWFSIGGTWDLGRLFKRLREQETDILDDGRVVGHVSAADVAMVEHVDHIEIKAAHDAEKALAEELERQAEQLEQEAEELEKEGKGREADKLEHKAEELEKEAEDLEDESGNQDEK